jgi:hypothetical protein
MLNFNNNANFHSHFNIIHNLVHTLSNNPNLDSHRILPFSNKAIILLPAEIELDRRTSSRFLTQWPEDLNSWIFVIFPKSSVVAIGAF